MKKPLYLDGNKLLRLVSDGPSLVAAANQGAPYRFPHRRLSRVIISGTLPQQSNGLIDCAADDIPVFVIKGNGKLACMILPPAPPRTSLGELLEQFDSQRSLAHTYSHWLENQRAHLMAKAINHLGLHTRGKQQAKEVLYREAKQLTDKAGCPRSYEVFNTLTNSQLVERLISRQLDMRKPSVDAFRRELLALFEPFILLMAARYGGTLASLSCLADCFHQQQDWLDTEISRLLVQLENQFAEEL